MEEKSTLTASPAFVISLKSVKAVCDENGFEVEFNEWALGCQNWRKDNRKLQSCKVKRLQNSGIFGWADSVFESFLQLSVAPERRELTDGNL
jgi:hypothetical protein